MTWWNFEYGSGVLELDSAPLELHWLLVGGHSVAWWRDDWGRWVGSATVGLA